MREFPLSRRRLAALNVVCVAATFILLATPARGADVEANAVGVTYAPAVVVIDQGDRLFFNNVGPPSMLIPHSLTSGVAGFSGAPGTGFDGLFDSGTIASGERRQVVGASQLIPGAYPFYCRVHVHMAGVLVVR